MARELVCCRLSGGITKTDIKREAKTKGIDVSEYINQALQLAYNNTEVLRRISEQADLLRKDIDAVQDAFVILKRRE